MEAEAVLGVSKRLAGVLLGAALVATAAAPVTAAERVLINHAWAHAPEAGGASLIVLPLPSAVSLILPFEMACRAGGGTITVRGTDDRAIQRSGGPAVVAEADHFRLVRVDDGKRRSFSRTFIPTTIATGPEHTIAMTAAWSAGDGLLAFLAGADAIAVSGPGVDMLLPTDGMSRELAAFAKACAE